MRLIDRKLMDRLDTEASASPRRRSHQNWHDPDADTVQRFLVHMQAGTYVRPHCHTQQQRVETTLLLDGGADLILFDETGTVIKRVELSAGGDQRGVELAPGDWHSFHVPDRATLFEVKQGPYDPALDKCFAQWAPPEDSKLAARMQQFLARARVGESWRSPAD